MAEGRGFEPPRDLRPYPISSRTPSTGLGHPSAALQNTRGLIMPQGQVSGKFHRRVGGQSSRSSRSAPSQPEKPVEILPPRCAVSRGGGATCRSRLNSSTSLCAFPRRSRARRTRCSDRARSSADRTTRSCDSRSHERFMAPDRFRVSPQRASFKALLALIAASSARAIHFAPTYFNYDAACPRSLGVFR